MKFLFNESKGVTTNFFFNANVTVRQVAQWIENEYILVRGDEDYADFSLRTIEPIF